MCRTTDFYREDRFLRLKSISLQLSLSSTSVSLLPESLTLVFLPRINGTILEINGSKFLPDSPAFLSLHRVHHSDVVFASNDIIRAGKGVVFEVHVADNRLLRGVFRRCDDGVLRAKCKDDLRKEFGVREVEVCFTAENGVVMREKVVAKKRRFCRKFEVALEEIPEERECDVAEEEEERESDVCSCCCDEIVDSSDGGDDDVDHMMKMEIEGVKWAVDVGIWVVCLGVGFLVSRASARKLRHRKFLV